MEGLGRILQSVFQGPPGIGAIRGGLFFKVSGPTKSSTCVFRPRAGMHKPKSPSRHTHMWKHTHTYIYIYIHTYMYIYIYIYICMYV